MPAQSIFSATPSKEHADMPADDRRLFRRYPAGVEAEIVHIGGNVPCQIEDLSLGGAGVLLASDAAAPAVGSFAKLRSPAIAGGHPFPVEVRRIVADRVNLSFDLTPHDDFALTMFLMDNPATLDPL